MWEAYFDIKSMHLVEKNAGQFIRERMSEWAAQVICYLGRNHNSKRAKIFRRKVMTLHNSVSQLWPNSTGFSSCGHPACIEILNHTYLT